MGQNGWEISKHQLILIGFHGIDIYIYNTFIMIYIYTRIFAQNIHRESIIVFWCPIGCDWIG